MKRVKRPIKSNIQIPSDKEDIFSTEDISDILNLIIEKTGCDVHIEMQKAKVDLLLLIKKYILFRSLHQYNKFRTLCDILFRTEKHLIS